MMRDTLPQDVESSDPPVPDDAGQSAPGGHRTAAAPSTWSSGGPGPPPLDALAPRDAGLLRAQSAGRLRELLVLIAEGQAELANLELQRRQLLKVFEAIELHPVAAAPGPDSIRRAAEDHLVEIEAKVAEAQAVLDAVLAEEAEVRGMLEALLDVHGHDGPSSEGRPAGRPADRRRAAAEAQRQAVARAILATLVVEPGLTGLQVADALSKSGAASSNAVIPMIATLHQRGLLRRGGHKQWFVTELDAGG